MRNAESDINPSIKRARHPANSEKRAPTEHKMSGHEKLSISIIIFYSPTYE